MSATSNTPTRGPTRASSGLRERNKRDKLRRIKRAARELFLEKGFEGATAREICRRAGVGTGTLFLYVRDKRELLFLLFQDESRGLFAQGMEAASREETLGGGLMALVGRFFEFYAGYPELSAVVLEELFFRPQEPERMGALSREYASHVARLVAAAKERGEIDTDVPVSSAGRACFAHYAFWVQSWLGSRLVDREAAERLLREALELQLRGLGPRP